MLLPSSPRVAGLESVFCTPGLLCGGVEKMWGDFKYYFSYLELDTRMDGGSGS